MANEKILLGMSGGVDSSYAVPLLRQAGYEVIGAVLRMSDATDVGGAARAAEMLRVPLHILDCRGAFRRIVIADFIAEYQRARTPNPCALCNRKVKFETLCRFAREQNIPLVATGHYAKTAVDSESGRYYLKRADDRKKDQSYMLWRLTQEELSMLRLPLSDIHKEEVKSEAKKQALPAADQPESQEICFIPDNDYVAFIERESGAFPRGDFVGADGQVLGQHHGIIRYTIGQRKGLGISLGHPAFVTAIDPHLHTVTLDREETLFRTELTCRQLNFVKTVPGDYEGLSLSAKIRYGANPEPAEVTVCGDTATVRFAHPVRAITPGQSVVFYDGDDLCFGGVIES